MRTTLSLFVLLALLLEMPAQQTVTVTPQTLAGWSVTGADPKTLAGLPELTLPAGAQLAHSFDSTGVALQVTSSPVVGTAAADWPVLEIGNMALVFARSDTGGKLMLVVGDNQPIDLPFSYTLDEAGRSTEALTVGFSRQGSVATVTYANQTMRFPVGPPSDPKLDVVASAGSAKAWDFRQLEVVVSTASTDGSTGKNPANDGTKTKDALPLTAGSVGAANVNTGTNDPTATDALAKAAAEKAKNAASGSLEIFTPPSVRHGRADAVRAVLSGSKQN